MNTFQEPLKARAKALQKARLFFDEKGIVEIDPYILTATPSLDSHIDAVEAGDLFLHTSFEYPMKKALALTQMDLYNLGHVFRQEEVGRWHRTEFTMAEWYRIGFSLEKLIEETLDFLTLYLPKAQVETWTYKQAFQSFAGFDPFEETIPELARFDFKREECLAYHLVTSVEPAFQSKNFTLLTEFPASQAALAKTNGATAQRFEIYYQGIELANGYEELTDPQEMQGRLEKENKRRILQKKNPYPLDRELFQVLQTSPLPPCSGVAVGFDRLFALSLKKSLSECSLFS